MKTYAFLDPDENFLQYLAAAESPEAAMTDFAETVPMDDEYNTLDAWHVYEMSQADGERLLAAWEGRSDETWGDTMSALPTVRRIS